VEQDLPDLILLDLKMPGMTGIESLAALRTKARDALVIILTVYGTVKDWVEAMKLGAYGLLIKTVALEGVEDIVPLSKRFMVKYGMELGKEVVEIDPAAIANLERHPFPGNVRERQNVIERAMILCKGKILTAGDLPWELREVTAPVTVA
jgi:DNA-binding NtrC family response regulator